MVVNQNADVKRQEFLSQISPDYHFNRLFDHLPRVFFFAKNDTGQLLFVNQALARLYGCESELQLIGKSDFDLLPRNLAEKYRADDLRIMESGKPMPGIVELFLNPQGLAEWFITDKMPILSRTGQVIGVMGIIREYDGLDKGKVSYQDIGPAVDHLKTKFKENVSIKTLAKLSRLSVRQFERNFRKTFNTTPHQFLIKLRIHAACDLLHNKRMSISDIATELGFTDQSALARHFRKNMGYTPLQYRRKYL